MQSNPEIVFVCIESGQRSRVHLRRASAVGGAIEAPADCIYS
jgi:hypothetical protein